MEGKDILATTPQFHYIMDAVWYPRDAAAWWRRLGGFKALGVDSTGFQERFFGEGAGGETMER